MSPKLTQWLKFSIVALVGCGFVAMLIYALWMREAITTAQVEPQLITAPDAPVKRRPDEPGGLEIPNRDKMVFDLLESAPDATTSPTLDGDAELAAQLAEANLAPVAAPSLAEQVPAPSSATPAPVAGVNSPTAPVAEPSPTTRVEETVAPSPVAVVAQPEPKPEPKPAPKPEAKPEPKPEAKPVPKGSWGVQLAAVGSKADAQAAGKKLQAKFSALNGLTLRTSPSADGKAHRIQFVGLADRAAARNLCTKLGSGQPCFAVAP